MPPRTKEWPVMDRFLMWPTGGLSTAGLAPPRGRPLPPGQHAGREHGPVLKPRAWCLCPTRRPPPSATAPCVQRVNVSGYQQMRFCEGRNHGSDRTSRPAPQRALERPPESSSRRLLPRRDRLPLRSQQHLYHFEWAWACPRCLNGTGHEGDCHWTRVR
jgi:hypothetical protein